MCSVIIAGQQQTSTFFSSSVSTSSSLLWQQRPLFFPVCKSDMFSLMFISVILLMPAYLQPYVDACLRIFSFKCVDLKDISMSSYNNSYNMFIFINPTIPSSVFNFTLGSELPFQFVSISTSLFGYYILYSHVRFSPLQAPFFFGYVHRFGHKMHLFSSQR